MASSHHTNTVQGCVSRVATRVCVVVGPQGSVRHTHNSRTISSLSSSAFVRESNEALFLFFLYKVLGSWAFEGNQTGGWWCLFLGVAGCVVLVLWRIGRILSSTDDTQQVGGGRFPTCLVYYDESSYGREQLSTCVPAVLIRLGGRPKGMLWEWNRRNAVLLLLFRRRVHVVVVVSVDSGRHASWFGCDGVMMMMSVWVVVFVVVVRVVDCCTRPE